MVDSGSRSLATNTVSFPLPKLQARQIIAFLDSLFYRIGGNVFQTPPLEVSIESVSVTAMVIKK
jgi:hypothetical protein